MLSVFASYGNGMEQDKKHDLNKDDEQIRDFIDKFCEIDDSVIERLQKSILHSISKGKEEIVSEYAEEESIEEIEKRFAEMERKEKEGKES
jgi:hypothetical protein